MARVLSVALLLALTAAPQARAESPDVLPEGSFVAYGGLGFNTFSHLQFADDAEGSQHLDRALRSRLDLYGATGLTDWLQLSVLLPVVHSTVLETDRGPCPDGVGRATEEDYCEAFVTVGGTWVQARARALDRGGLTLTGGLGLGADLWNASKRGRYTAMGDASLDLQPLVLARYRVAAGAWKLGLVGQGAYTFRMGRLTEGQPAFSAPADDVRWAAEVHLEPPAPLKVELGLQGVQRLWGLDWDGAYQAEYFGTLDRWTVLWYRHLAATAKLSLALSDSSGVHLGAGRVISVRNGPPDTLDVSVGVHHYFAPKSR